MLTSLNQKLLSDWNLNAVANSGSRQLNSSILKARYSNRILRGIEY
jgi:hypothetical protein